VRDQRGRSATATQQVDRAGDEAAQHALGHGGERRQRLRGHHGRGLLPKPRFLLQCQVPHLGPVAVNNHHPPAGLEHVVDGRGHGHRVGHHLVMGAGLARPGQGVAAERNDRDLGHGILLIRGQS